MDGLNPAFDATLLSRIEDAGLNASAPPQQRWVDGWLLRLSPGKAKRARCINAVADGRMPVTQRLSYCATAFAQAQLPMIVRITPFSLPEGLDAQLAQHGLRRFDDTRVMVLADLQNEAAPLAPGLAVVPIGLERFAERVGGFRGSPVAQQEAHAQRLLASPVPFHAFGLQHEGQAVACGQFAIEDDLVGLYDVFTAEHARGRGLAGSLCSQLLAQARQHGARHAYLQVETDNAAARAVYRRLGFTDAYAYHYRTEDSSTA